MYQQKAKLIAFANSFIIVVGTKTVSTDKKPPQGTFKIPLNSIFRFNFI